MSTDSTPSKKTPVIIVFGPSGAGKSSVVNMLTSEADGPKAVISSSAVGVTMTATSYVKSFHGKRVEVYDTAGLNEDSQGSVPGVQAIEALHSLIQSIPPNGISLLVFVLPAGRITELTQKNYVMFFDTFCQKQVKIVAIFTRLEHEADMDRWWDANKSIFDRYGMRFSGQACITASPLFPALYEESSKRVTVMLSAQLEGVTPWIPTPENWLADILLKPAFQSPILLKSNFIRNLSPDLKQAISSYASVVNDNLPRPRRPRSQAPPMNGGKIVVLAIGIGGHPSYLRNSDRIESIFYDLNDIGIDFSDSSTHQPEDMMSYRDAKSPNDSTNPNFAALAKSSILRKITKAVKNTTTSSRKNTKTPEDTNVVKIYDKLRAAGSKGINLVLMVVPKLPLENGRWKVIYDVLYNQFLQQYVPISLLISDSPNATGDKWATDRASLDRDGMFFHSHQYLPPLQPSKAITSDSLVVTLIKESYTPIPFVVTDPDMGFSDLVRSYGFWRKMGFKNKVLLRDLYDAFVEYRDMDHIEAVDLSNALGRKYYRQHLKDQLKHHSSLKASTSTLSEGPIGTKTSS